MAGILTRVMRRLGRFIEPLVDPDAADRRRRDAAIAKRLEAVGTSLSRLAEQVQRVTERVDKIDRRQIDHLDDAVSALKASTRRQATLTGRLVGCSSLRHYRGLIREVSREVGERPGVLHPAMMYGVFDSVGGGSLTVVDAAIGSLLRHLAGTAPSSARARF
jgi:hypothetical protein